MYSMRQYFRTSGLFILSLLFLAALTNALAPSAEGKESQWPEWTSQKTDGRCVEPLTDEQIDKWMHWVIPLPKRVCFRGKLALPATAISLKLRAKATAIEKTGLDELRNLITKKTGTKELSGDFPILIGVCDTDGKIDGVTVPGAAHLIWCKNSEQAYFITPLTTRGMAVTALDERGVYYGLKTLAQLLEPNLADGKLTVPIVTVLDWPDLAERGLWGGSANSDIQYMADRKLNLIEAQTRMNLDEQGRGVVKLCEDDSDIEHRKQAGLRAIKWVPIIIHLDHLSRTGVFKRFPELEGKGPAARRDNYVSPCFSQPKMREILADWFASVAAFEGVDDICVWLSEIREMGCGCAQCKKKGQWVMETEAAVRAWRLARKKHPDIGLRILLTQGSYATNDKVLAAAASPEIGITYYSGETTYDSTRDEMIYPFLADFAKSGRWLGVYPQLTASWRIVTPWSAPQFIKSRMNEFVDKGLECICGYATPDSRCYDFNITAMAEWSWNTRGRNEREFAVAWATRHGISNPQKAADWAVTLGPVGWDVYGSDVPYGQFFGNESDVSTDEIPVAVMIRKRKPPSWLDPKGAFRYFPTQKHMDDNLSDCNTAMKLAEELDKPEIIAETHVIRGYLRMIKSIYCIAESVADKQKLDPQATQALQADYDELNDAGREVVDGLKNWVKDVKYENPDRRFSDTIEVTNNTVTAIGKALEPFGIRIRP